MEHVVVQDIERPSKEIVEEFKTVSVASCHEVMGKMGLMDYEIKPVTPGTKLVGSAITVWLPPGDNLMLHKAMTLVKPGDVLVIHSEGGKTHGATWGALLNLQGIIKECAGIVTDGTVRDVSEIRESRFPCFAKAISPLGTAKASAGSVNIPITCGGVLIKPRDIVVGDDDGVVVVPKEIALEILKKAKDRELKEAKWRNLIKEGKTIYEIAGFDVILAKKGVKEVSSPHQVKRS